MERPGGLAAIGDTPVVRLDRLVEPGMAEVWVKLESANPTGSYKDRMALAMIEGAERSGRLRPGQTVVEYTGGEHGTLARVRLLRQGLSAADRQLRRLRRSRRSRRCGRSAPTSSSIPSPEGITPDADPADAGARRRDRGGDRRLSRPTSSTTPTWSTGYRGPGRGARSSSSTVALDAICIYVGTAGLLPRRRRARCASGCRPPSRGRRTGRVGGAVRPAARHPPHRGRRHRVRPAAAPARRDRRGHRGLDAPTRSRWRAGPRARTASGRDRRRGANVTAALASRPPAR